MIRAAGILIVYQGTILLIKRAGDGDYPGTWCIPGGKIENDETAIEAAARETFEETDVAVPLEALAEWTRTTRDGVDFTSYVASVGEEPQISLDETESTEFGWFKIDELPAPLHPGMPIVVQRFAMDELDIAEAMTRGNLASPSVYQNVTLFNIRITGTGLSYRVEHEEYVWRDPAVYVNERFLRRCNGLIVIWEHPESTIVDSKEFSSRIVGTVFLPYVPADKPDEVWAIVKIYDDAAVEILVNHAFSTSPSVVLRKSATATAQIAGSTLLIEGKPALVDHIALCPNGVWDKGGAPDGVESADIIRADANTGHLRECETRVKRNSSLAAAVKFSAAVFAATKGNR